MANWILESTLITRILANRGVSPAVTRAVLFPFWNRVVGVLLYMKPREKSFFLRRWVAWSWHNIQRSNISDFAFNDRSFPSSVTIKIDPWYEFSEVQVIHPQIKEPKDLRHNTSARGLVVYFIWDNRVYHFLGAQMLIRYTLVKAWQQRYLSPEDPPEAVVKDWNLSRVKDV